MIELMIKKALTPENNYVSLINQMHHYQGGFPNQKYHEDL